MERVCILTGGSSGIGKATALALSKTSLFTHYVLIGRNKETVDSVVEKVKENKVEAMFVFGDLSKPESLANTIDIVCSKFKRISALLNIAGYTDPEPLFGTTLENLQTTFNTNVFSPFILIREFSKFMREKGGKIVNIASTAGTSSRPGWVSYASSKASLISMSKTLADELFEYGIKVYCLSPGRCATDLRKKLAPDEDYTKIMQPEAVAEVITTILNSSGNFLDGQDIVVRQK